MTKIIKQKVQKSVSEKEILNLKIKKNCLEAVKIENKIKHSEKKKKKKKIGKDSLKEDQKELMKN